MKRAHQHSLLFLPLFIFFSFTSALAAGSFRVATFNVNNYLDAATEGRTGKSPEAKAKVREGLLAVKAAVLALQEMGTTNELAELQTALRQDGLDYPEWEWVAGYDPLLLLAILSRFPSVARRPYTNESFLLNGRRFRVSQSFADVDLQINDHEQITLLAAHLKSRLPRPEADQAEWRL